MAVVDLIPVVDPDSVVDLDARGSLDRAARYVDACDAGAAERACAPVAVGATGVEVVGVMGEPVDLVEDRLFDGPAPLVPSLRPPFDLDPTAARATGHQPKPE